MKEVMTILNGATFRTSLKRVRREFPMDSFKLFPQRDGTTLVVRHDVAVMWNMDVRVKPLPKPVIQVRSLEELLGWVTLKGFTHISFNEGDGWTTRCPFAAIKKLPPFWVEFKLRFYRSANSPWEESMTLYPAGGGGYRHVKELF